MQQQLYLSFEDPTEAKSIPCVDQAPVFMQQVEKLLADLLHLTPAILIERLIAIGMYTPDSLREEYRNNHPHPKDEGYLSFEEYYSCESARRFYAELLGSIVSGEAETMDEAWAQSTVARSLATTVVEVRMSVSTSPAVRHCNGNTFDNNLNHRHGHYRRRGVIAQELAEMKKRSAQTNTDPKAGNERGVHTEL